MLRLRLLNLLLQGRLERCRWVQQTHKNTLKCILHTKIRLYVSVVRNTVTLIFCPGGPSDAPSPDIHQLSSPLHPQRPEALWQQTAHAEVYTGTKCSHLEANIENWRKTLIINCCSFFSFPPNILCAGGAETFPRWRSSARPHRWHGHQRPCTEESYSESGGLRAPHVLPPPAQWPQFGICLFSVWEESSGKKLDVCVFQFVGELNVSVRKISNLTKSQPFVNNRSQLLLLKYELLLSFLLSTLATFC